MIRKLQRQQAHNRRNSIKTELVRSKRSIIDGAIGLDVNKLLRSEMEKLITEYNARKMAEMHVYERKTFILNGGNTTPIRKRRLESLQKHYEINFEAKITLIKLSSIFLHRKFVITFYFLFQISVFCVFLSC